MAAHAQRRVERLKVSEPVEELRTRALYARAPRDFAAALSGVVMDLRFAEPGRGLLVNGGEVNVEHAAKRATSAAGRGATGIGIWTERNFHAGDYKHLDAAREACPDALIVMMDYVIDPWQLERARAGGADAVLLIPALLGPYLGKLVELSRGLGLTPVDWPEGGAPRIL